MPISMSLSALVLASFHPASAENVSLGQAIAMGSGTARTFFVRTPDGKPDRLGVSMTKTAFDNLPFAEYNQGAKTFELDLPKGLKGVPFDHASIDYATLGHEPLEIYGSAHFDFHFYLCNRKNRRDMKITGPTDVKTFDKPVAPGYMPANYVMIPGTEIPGMGVHWVDMSSGEFHGHGFKSTMIMGSYDGSLVFIEPMVSQAFLESMPDFTARIVPPRWVKKSGYYPTQYGVSYNTAENLYQVWLGKFVYIKGSA